MKRTAAAKLWIAVVLGGCSGCGRNEKSTSERSASNQPAAAVQKAKPQPPRSCFDDSRWAAPDCAGTGDGPPLWWGAQRWPQLRLRSKRTLKDVRGHVHWSLDLVRPQAWAEVPVCIDAMKKSLTARFPTLEQLPSSLPERASFRGRSSGYEITVVCGTSARKELLINVDLMRLTTAG